MKCQLGHSFPDIYMYKKNDHTTIQLFISDTQVSNVSIDDFACVFRYMQVPSWIIKKMADTRESDGEQYERFENVEVKWRLEYKTMKVIITEWH
jgi:hypothetical protein